MRIAFAGTPAFAASALAALLDAGREVCVVLSQPDRPAGRGQHLQASPVKQLAAAHGLPVLTPPGLRPERSGAPAAEAIAALRAAAPDILVVAAYGLILPEAVLQLPRGLPLGAGRIGAVNIHASLLPRWRGAAPVVRAIEAGDAVTGITIMQMEAGLDTGPILLMRARDIAPDDTAATLTDGLARLGGTLLLQALDDLEHGRLQARAQPDEGITYAHKVEKREAWVDWYAAAERIAARVRAFDPFPGAASTLGGQVVKIWGAQVVDTAPASAPGTVETVGAEGIVVACGRQCLRLTQLQRSGGRRLAARDFLAGAAIAPGATWSSPADATRQPHGD